MNSEAVNKYIFADLVQRNAQQQRRIRQLKMEAEGCSEDEINSSPITPEDVSKALATLDWYLEQVEKLKT